MNVKFGYYAKRKDICMTSAEREKIIREVSEELEKKYQKQIAEMKVQLTDKCLEETYNRNSELLEAISKDNLYILTLSYVYALYDGEGFQKNRLMRVLNKVADIQQGINDGNISALSIEKKLEDLGIVLKEDDKGQS